VLWVFDPLVERFVVPNNVRGLKGRRISAETGKTPGLSIPQARKAWPCHVLVALQRMTSRARVKYALASACAAFRTSYILTE
jgi:hypothetical protein